MKTVITTVGTSIFSNYFDKEKNTNIYSSIKPHYEKLKNKSSSEWVSFQPRIHKLKPKIINWAKNNKEASAEIKSLLAIRDDINDDLNVYLVATDTILSSLAAEIIKEVFKSDNKIDIKFDCNVDIINDLRVVDARKFAHEGLFNLINRIKQIQNDNTVFNITGGFKAVIPYLTIMAQIYGCEIYYIFEETDELISIRKMPIDFDFSIIEENYIAFTSLNKTKEDNLPTINAFKEDLSENLDEQENEYGKLEKYNLIQADAEKDKVKFTVLGKLFLEKYNDMLKKDEFERQKLIGKIVELKVFEYYNNKCENSAVKPGEKSGVYDIDVYIETENKKIAIEIKPGDNVPLWEEKDSNKSLEYKIKAGAFFSVLNKDDKENKDMELKVFLYSHKKDIHPRVLRQINELNDKYKEETKNLKWYHLHLPENYKSNVDWKVDTSRIKELTIERGINENA
jgi:putative CRISPR-associated protein (TIGR02619 family)